MVAAVVAAVVVAAGAGVVVRGFVEDDAQAERPLARRSATRREEGDMGKEREEKGVKGGLVRDSGTTSSFQDMPGRARRLPLPPALVGYWNASRAPRYSVIFALPLLLLYEGMATFLPAQQGTTVRNGADVLFREFFLSLAGRQYAPLVFGVTVVGVSVWFVVRDLRATHTPFSGRVFLGMFVESVVLALCFGSVVGSVTAHLLAAAGDHPATATALAIAAPARWLATVALQQAGGPLAGQPTATKVMLSLGAGLYEELLFRVILVSGIALIARRILGWRPATASILGAVLSALVFSAFHYIGPYGDQFRLDSFVFRFIGGLAFSVLYVLRGFGITAWTHALYDLMVLAT